MGRRLWDVNEHTRWSALGIITRGGRRREGSRIKQREKRGCSTVSEASDNLIRSTEAGMAL